jgi:type I restriction enzyme S subunit
LRSDTEQLDPNYLFYFTQTDSFISHLTELSTGAGYPAVSDEDILDTRIPLPPLTEQKRIASLLARADRLRQLRRTAHDLGDALLQSVFLEMFGDDKYDLMEFREAVKIDRTAASENDGKTLPYVGLEDIEKDKGDFTKDYQPVVQNMLATNYRFTPKHVLYGKLRPYLNKVAMPSFAGVCTTEILPLLPASGKVNKAYLWAYMRSKKFIDWASNNVAGANLPRLSPELLGDYPFPVPPLSLQEEFAGVVARVESLRGRMGESTRGVEGLFESLLAEAFS